MIILRQREFANKKNKEMVRDWKLRQRIRGSGIVDKINEEREAQVRKLTGGQEGVHATKLTEEEIFNQAKGGRRAYQDKIKFDKGVSNSASVFVGEDPELFKRVNKDTAARGTNQVQNVNHNINSMITNKGADNFIGNRKSSAYRRREIGLPLSYRSEKYHMSSAEYHAKRAAEKKAAEEAAKKAAEEAAKATPKPTPTPTPKPTTTSKVAAKEGNKVLGWVKKNPGTTAVGVLGTAGLAYGGKKLYDHYKNREK